MYRDEELDINEENEDLRKSKHYSPYMTSQCYAMPCPMMQMPMMQQPMMQMPMMEDTYQSKCKCPMCGKSTNWRNDEDFELEGEDDRDQYSKPYYHHNYKPYYKPYYNPYFKPYHKPYHPYGPGWMKRDFE